MLATSLLALLLIAVPQEPGQLDDALALRLTFPASLQAGKPAFIGHCARAPSGCRRRVEIFAEYFFYVGEETGMSPWLLAAVAVHESRLNPAAEGPCGKWACRGIMQIHERWRGAPPYIKSAKARKRCSRQIGACQEPVVRFAANLLRSEIERCGSLEGGLGAYNTGRCGRGLRYARKVQLELEHLHELAEEEAKRLASRKKREQAA